MKSSPSSHVENMEAKRACKYFFDIITTLHRNPHTPTHTHTTFSYMIYDVKNVIIIKMNGLKIQQLQQHHFSVELAHFVMISNEKNKINLRFNLIKIRTSMILWRGQLMEIEISLWFYNQKCVLSWLCFHMPTTFVAKQINIMHNR